MLKIYSKLETLLTNRANVIAESLQDVMERGTIEEKLRRILWTRIFAGKLEKWEQRVQAAGNVEDQELEHQKERIQVLAQFWQAEAEVMRTWKFQNLSADRTTIQDIMLMLIVSDLMKAETSLIILEEKLQG
jgi:hypothetical protein